MIKNPPFTYVDGNVYFRLKELAKAAGVKQATIKNYTRGDHPILPTVRGADGRLYLEPASLLVLSVFLSMEQSRVKPALIRETVEFVKTSDYNPDKPVLWTELGNVRFISREELADNLTDRNCGFFDIAAEIDALNDAIDSSILKATRQASIPTHATN